MKLRLIGDVHGHIEKYVQLINSVKKCDRSIQLGDMGFSRDYDQLIEAHKYYKLPVGCHKFIGGNHDDYDNIPTELMLSNYGTIIFSNHTFFYIRGAESVDKRWRTKGQSWWPEEELTYDQAKKAIEMYDRIKPEYMLTHDCPKELLMFFLTNPMKQNNSRTGEILQQCFEIHKPKYWFFGHHHIDKEIRYKGTTFRCLNELSHIDLEI